MLDWHATLGPTGRLRMKLRRISPLTWIMTTLIVATLVLGIVGYARVPKVQLGDSAQSTRAVGHALDVLYLSLGLLWLNGKNTYGNYCLMIGRWTGALFAFASLVKLLAPRLVQGIQHLRIRRLDGHTIVVGFDEKGRSFALDAAKRGAVVVFDPATQDLGDLDATSPHPIFLWTAPLTVGLPTRQAALDRAAQVIITTGNDVTNLVIAREVIQQASARSSDQALEVFVHVGDPVLRLNGLAGFPHRAGISLRPFSLPALAARRLTAAFPFGVLARLQGAPSIHLVFMGFDAYAEEILLQTLRIGSLDPGKRPTISVFVPTASALRSRLERNFPALPELARLHFLEYDLASDLTEAELAAVEGFEGGTPVTAVVVTHRTDQEAIVLARRTRTQARRFDRWRAPLFVRLERPADFETALAPLAKTKWLSRSIDAFGDLAEICSARGFRTWQEQLAQDAHSAWFEKAGPETRSPAAKTWYELDEEYRDANRRAIDHFEVKLTALGYIVRSDPPRLRRPLVFEERKRMMLAELEHESWAAEKRLAGWRFGRVRDPARRRHEDLVPFDQLGPEVQKDLAQVDLLAKLLASPAAGAAPTCFRERRIGLVREAGGAAASLAAELSKLDIETHLGPDGDELWTFVVPFRSGVDLPVAEELCRFLTVEAAPRPPSGRYRLLMAVHPEATNDPQLARFIDAERTVELALELPPPSGPTADAGQTYLARTCEHVLRIR